MALTTVFTSPFRVLLCYIGIQVVMSYCPYDCYYDCCGSYPDEYCCGGPDVTGTSDVFLTTWAIVGIVIGCILFISVIVAIVCCCIKSQGHSGGVVHSQPSTNNVSVIYPGTIPRHPGPAYGMQPMVASPPYGMYANGVHAASPYPSDQPPAYPPPAYNPPGVVPEAGRSTGAYSDPFAPPPPGLNVAPATYTSQ